MPSRRRAWLWLLHKEWRELLSSRAWWLFLLLMGGLTGVCFISAVRTYGEASGMGGTASGVGEAFSPLVGIWGPTFSACELAAAFLLPFVAIRLVAGDRQSGALKIEMQHPMSSLERMAVKALVLFGGWIIALAAPGIAVVLWKSYGGSVYLPELMSVVSGHLLNAGLTIALACAAAAVTEHPSTAAILTLAVTVGTWVLGFIAAVHGGMWELAANYTPTALVAEFQHGLVRLDVVLIALVLLLSGLALAAIWTRLGVAVPRRVYESVALAALATFLVAASTFTSVSWDLSESRINSFSRSDERALHQIKKPLQIDAYLAPEDPRRADLEHKTISKLRRVLPRVQVRYISATSIGLFEQSNPHYGEIWYKIDGRQTMSRATSPETVLEAIYSVANIAPPPHDGDDEFRGHPLATSPRHAAGLFYGLWPASIIALGLFVRRRDS